MSQPKPFGHPSYHTNKSMVNPMKQTPCVYCGRGMKSPKHFLFLTDMNEAVAKHESDTAIGFMGIGSDCAAMFKAAGVPVYGPKDLEVAS